MAHPEFEGDDIDELTPVPPLSHLPYPTRVSEREALVMNIVLPPEDSGDIIAGSKKDDSNNVPIFVYVHGGSLLYGGSHLAIFDCVRLVEQSVQEGRPIVAITFNYRVGLGGFLASQVIREELSMEGFSGCGNFGFTDQIVALQWVQMFGKALGGDVNQVTVCGESAGGISISSLLLSHHASGLFQRAVCMSGLAYSIPAWSMEKHEELFQATCHWFNIDPGRQDALQRLRKVPEQELANACPGIFGVGSGTGNPCIDGWFYEDGKDPKQISNAPEWLAAFMIGDVYHEGVIFHLNIVQDEFKIWRKIFVDYLEDDSVVDEVLELYGISPDLSHEILLERFEYMAGDAVFRIPNYLTAIANQRLTERKSMFLYHFDQRSKIKNSLEGTAYHAYELLYLFQNLVDQMSTEEQQMARDFASAFINFAHGTEPWETRKESAAERSWKLWGPHGKQAVVLEADDEELRRYKRMETMLKIGEAGRTWHKWFDAIDAIVNRRWQLGMSKSEHNSSRHAGW